VNADRGSRAKQELVVVEKRLGDGGMENSHGFIHNVVTPASSLKARSSSTALGGHGGLIANYANRQPLFLDAESLIRI
jgi:hypothetical protein